MQSNRYFSTECQVVCQNSAWSLGQRDPNPEIKRQLELEWTEWGFAFKIRCQKTP